MVHVAEAAVWPKDCLLCTKGSTSLDARLGGPI